MGRSLSREAELGGVKLFLVFGSPIFAALVLIYLLLPGTLISESAILAQGDAALEQRLARLREFAEFDVCEAPTTPPTIVTPQEALDGDPVFRPVPVDPETSQVPREVVVATTPDNSVTDGPTGGAPDDTATATDYTANVTSTNVDDARSLADLIRNSTVLIIALGDGDSGMGTGFVVDDQHIITNFHVVDGANRFVANSRASGQPFELELVATVEGDVVSGTADLALLRATEPLSLGRLALVPFPSIMDGVFAAGYPDFVVATDDDYKSLIAGDVGSVPSIVITQGRISAIQNRDSAAPLLVHSAEISQGNSGGPLIDECGRVVGINTFGRTDQKNAANRTVFYAQPSQTALDAFADAGADIHVVEGFCGTVTKKDISPQSPDDGATQ